MGSGHIFTHSPCAPTLYNKLGGLWRVREDRQPGLHSDHSPWRQKLSLNPRSMVEHLLAIHKIPVSSPLGPERAKMELDTKLVFPRLEITDQWHRTFKTDVYERKPRSPGRTRARGTPGSAPSLLGPLGSRLPLPPAYANLAHFQGARAPQLGSAVGRAKPSARLRRGTSQLT